MYLFSFKIIFTFFIENLLFFALSSIKTIPVFWKILSEFLCILFQARHIYICDYHKQYIQNARIKQQQQQRRRKDSEEDSGETDNNDHPEVDLYQLQVGTLRRYRRHFGLQPRQTGMNKAQLADVSLKNLLHFLITLKKMINMI